MPSSVPMEPTPERLRNPVLRYVLATRPAFLTITFAGCLLGFSTAHHAGAEFHPWTAALTLVLALLAHAGVNVVNDYYDHLNGTDAINSDRVFPFTGGSRFIQNGVLSPLQMLGWGLLLFALVIAGGLWLIGQTGQGLFWIGLAGLFVGWAYSAVPIQLNSRGFGEPCVTVGFTLVVVGADYVQRGAFSALPWLAAMPYAMLTTNILFINQFPDRAADRAAGKRHWVVRLPTTQAARVYGLIALLSAAWLAAMVSVGVLPRWSWFSLAAWVPVVGAYRTLQRHADHPGRLAPAIRTTILAAHLHAILLSAALLLGHRP